MKPFLSSRWFVVALCLIGSAGPGLAQRPGANAVAAKLSPGAYNIANDVSLQGTVLKYTENSQTPPIGTHVLVQTASGNVDVHLGDARLLHLAKMNILQGASVRFIGQSRTVGQNTIFLARLVQVGGQVLAVRSNHGLPLAAAGVRGNKALLANIPADQRGGAR